MKSDFLKKGNKKLLILALGWGQENTYWLSQNFGERDVLILSQWDTPDPLPDISGYDGYDLIAWSFGVWSAAQLDWGVSFDHALAVNGTLIPADDEKGIPVNIFHRTISAWRPGISARKFWRRMGAESLPDRDDESLLAELQYFERCFSKPENFRDTVHYTQAIIGEEDRIFPPENQKRAWKNIPTSCVNLPHDITQNFQQILDVLTPNNKIDKSHIARRFKKSHETYDQHAIVQRVMARRLSLILPQRTFDRAFEFGCGTGNLTKLLQKKCKTLFRNDLHPDDSPDYLEGDIETLSFPQDLDLIASNAVWQWLNDPVKMLRKIYDALNKDGIVAISTFAPGTCGEISKLLHVSLDYQEPEDFRKSCEAYFDVLAFEKYTRVLTFQEPYQVLKHLKYTGVTGVNSSFRWGRKKLEAFDQAYREQFPDVSLTYLPVLFIGKKKEKMES